MEIIIRHCDESDIEKIKHYINKFGLDSENLNYEQFYIAETDGETAGFGRIKQYGNIYELASIGVLEKFRKNHIGTKIINKLSDNCPAQEIWLTTVIPEYFKQFGFEEDDNVPDEILLKCSRVCKKLNKTTQNSHYMRLKKHNSIIE